MRTGCRLAGVGQGSALLVTGREVLVEEVSDLASAAGVAVGVVADVAAAGRAWAAADLVLVGDDAAVAGVPSRRDGVVLLAPADAGGGEELWRAAVGVGAAGVLLLPRDRQAVLHQLALVAELDGSGSGRVVAVLGARGGVGASSLAAALALRASGLGRALLVDGDPLGGGLDLLVGLERSGGFRWPELAGARGTVRSSLLREGLPRAGALAVLSYDRAAPIEPLPAAAVTTVLSAARRGHDAVVLDLPRRDDAATLAALAAAEVLLLVVPPEVRAVAAAARVLDLATTAVADVRLVLARTGGPRGAELPAAAVVDALGVPLAAELGREVGLAAAVDRGEPPGSRYRGALARCCEQLDPVMAPATPVAL